MRKLFVIAILFIFSCGGVFASPITWTPPTPPAAQAGDDTQTTATVGEMRLALWYYQQYELLVGKTIPDFVSRVNDITSLNAALQTQLATADTENKKLSSVNSFELGVIAALAAATLGEGLYIALHK
ncbi:hypothetical protein KGP36_06525 [Patescibacteria group bacterium]|nr:hypothetical protein [Patescibacteria group bacterium]